MILLLNSSFILLPFPESAVKKAKSIVVVLPGLENGFH
jgi:hypothetical protein